MAQPGYKFSRARFDSVLSIPIGLGNLKNISGGQDTGQIRFNKSDSSVYVWNGRGWIKAGGGTIPTLTQVLESAAGANEAGANQIKDLSAGTSTNDAATFGQLIDTANLRLRLSDTATMLSNYAKTAAVALKLNISDTATMLAPYTRVTVSSYGKNAGRDSTILLLSNGTRYAAKDSVGGGGASGWSLTGNASAVTDFLGTTNNRTMRFRTNNVERMTIDSTGKVVIGTSTAINTDGAFIHTANNNSKAFSIAQNGAGTFFEVGNSNGNFLKINATGNIGINQTTDGGYKLDVTGTTRFAGNSLVANPINANNELKLQISASNRINFLSFANSDNTTQGSILGTGSALSYGTYLGNQINILGGSGGVALRTNNASNIRFYGTNSDLDLSTVQLQMFSATGNVHFQNGGTYTDVPSARIAVNSTTQGVLFPRMTTTQRNAISSPATGLNVYNTTLSTNDVKTAAAWYQQPNGLSGSGTLDFASTSAFSSTDLTVAITGAAVGDIVMLGTPVQDANSTFTAFVSAADTVTIRMNNYSALAINPASGTFKVYVIKN